MAPSDTDDWLEEQPESEQDDESVGVDEYEVTATPNDFNVATIVDFITRGVFEIPTFQRNFVWDVRRASKLIESLIMGLPVPQLFLYEKGKNRFLVVDGQQRLMSVYYFIKKRFPRMEKRIALRRVFAEHGEIPPKFLEDDTLFTKFNLKLPSRLPEQKNRLHGLNYDTLGDDKDTLDLRTVRCVVIKQTKPDEDNSSVYEIFSRLNTGGVNLSPQEIRSSLFESPFFRLLHRLNLEPVWRAIIGLSEPELHMRDIEVLLRGYAMLVSGPKYKPSMARFLNGFSKEMKKASTEYLEQLERVFKVFLSSTDGLPQGVFGTGQRKLNVSVFEAVFAAACKGMFSGAAEVTAPLTEEKINALKSDPEFLDAARSQSTDAKKVGMRLRKAEEVIRPA